MKTLQRKKATESRRALSAQERRLYSSIICQKLMELEEVKRASVVFSYLAAWDEVDLDMLHGELASRNVKLAFPVSFKGGIMEAYHPRDEKAIKEGMFGIKSPVVEMSEKIMPEDIELVLIPCLAFDGDKNRLGHGGGYYDRYLPKCSKAARICVAFEAQRLESIYTDKYDIKPDMIITEKTVY